ncbi:MAG: S46 family peptidase, partial [Longimicrobiales bacterium]|nr:S46 family peptidase [Longimicrobiales bacterium]
MTRYSPRPAARPGRLFAALAALAAVSALSALLAAPAGARQAAPAAPVAAGSVLEFGTMWTFDAPPVDYWSRRYGFDVTQEWLDHLRLSAIRLPGCSSSFVSADGLVMTNHHCARSCIAAVSPPETDFMQEGFVAATRADELSCPGFYVDQLVSIENVTGRVRAAVTATDPEAQLAERTAVLNDIRTRCEADSGNRCQVVAFYNGGMYSLYQYRRFDDVRLVMAPELDAAYFGGDPDNFTYPRYDLDVTFLRVWLNGAPLRPEHHLAWSEAGAVEDEPIFVVGNPGSTGRLLTLAQMEYLRDVDYPARLAGYDQRLDVLYAYTDAHPDALRVHQNTIFGIENSRKATTGYLAGLLDEGIMARKRAFEEDFRGRIQADPALDARYGSAWDEIADAQLELATFAPQLRTYALNGSTLLARALSVVRLAVESERPESERLAAFRGEGAARVRAGLLRDDETDVALERMQLEAWLAAALDELGPQDPLVRALLGPRTPNAAAERFLSESLLLDLGDRAPLVEGGLDALRSCSDPLVAAVLELDPVARGYQRRAAQLQAVVAANTEKLGQAIFAAYGTALPPDATFTLRISDGVVKGFPYNGTIAPYRTSFYGLFARSAEFDDQPPFRIPERWRAAEARLDLTTPYNFVSTADIIGGNSGSPVVNRAGEVVGLVFDGNIEMLPNRFIFTDEVSRTVSVHSLAITEALEQMAQKQGVEAKVRVERAYNGFTLTEDDDVIRLAKKAVAAVGV